MTYIHSYHSKTSHFIQYILVTVEVVYEHDDNKGKIRFGMNVNLTTKSKQTISHQYPYLSIVEADHDDPQASPDSGINIKNNSFTQLLFPLL